MLTFHDLPFTPLWTLESTDNFSDRGKYGKSLLSEGLSAKYKQHYMLDSNLHRVLIVPLLTVFFGAPLATIPSLELLCHSSSSDLGRSKRCSKPAIMLCLLTRPFRFLLFCFVQSKADSEFHFLLPVSNFHRITQNPIWKGGRLERAKFRYNWLIISSTLTRVDITWFTVITFYCLNFSLFLHWPQEGKENFAWMFSINALSGSLCHFICFYISNPFSELGYVLFH